MQTERKAVATQTENTAVATQTENTETQTEHKPVDTPTNPRTVNTQTVLSWHSNSPTGSVQDVTLHYAPEHTISGFKSYTVKPTSQTWNSSTSTDPVSGTSPELSSEEDDHLLSVDSSEASVTQTPDSSISPTDITTSNNSDSTSPPDSRDSLEAVKLAVQDKLPPIMSRLKSAYDSNLIDRTDERLVRGLQYINLDVLKNPGSVNIIVESLKNLADSHDLEAFDNAMNSISMST